MDTVVHATQMGNGQWAIECSECGAVSLTASANADFESAKHLQTHVSAA